MILSGSYIIAADSAPVKRASLANPIRSNNPVTTMTTFVVASGNLKYKGVPRIGLRILQCG